METSTFTNFIELSQILKARLDEVATTRKDILSMKECIAALAKLASELGPNWHVRAFGGMSNGFGMHGSDLDATCYMKGGPDWHAQYAVQELQMQFLPRLRANPKFEVSEEIWSARIPILKLRYEGSLEVDLSCHNTEPLANTHLLRSYAKLDPVVRDMGLMVKLWAKAEGVCGAAGGNLSSYALTMMVLYFLQVDPEVRMPCLPTWAFTISGGPPAAELGSWVSGKSRGELLARFFNFYASQFQWGTEVASVRYGRRAATTDTAYSELRARLSSRLHIEDPFLVSRNLHCTLNPEQEGTLYHKICEAARSTQSGKTPAGLTPARAYAQDTEHQGGEADVAETKTQDTNSPSAADPVEADLPKNIRSDNRAGSSESTRSERIVTSSSESESRTVPSPDKVPMTVLQGSWRL